MNDTSDFYFQSYEEWRAAITVRCNIKLTREYARERISALENPNDPHTQEFAEKFGKAYLQQVINWFARAEKGS
ncbi:MAG: hypothetical protein GJ680_16000 [Alteromonadaceae bacterium]|nr:hypothetical protein [Alteromonadaceae bacterium]